jgi:hypothetical protein
MSKEKTMHELAKEFPNKTYGELEKYREEDRQQEAGVCIMGEARKDREEINWKTKCKELEVALANALAVNESHQKLNGKLQERLTEVEEENKKMNDHLDRQVQSARKAGI